MSHLKQLCASKNPKDMDIVEININKLDNDCWKILCENPNAFYIIKKFIEHYGIGSFNTNEYLKHICKNKNATDLIITYKDKLDKECINNLYLNENGMKIIQELY